MSEASTPAKRPAARTTAVSNLTMGSADDALTVAKELQTFVQANNLTSTIQGKQFPNVEAWQFAGTLLGLSPMLESIEDKSTEAEIKWHATVVIQNVKTGNIVGRGFATCSNKEYSKKSFADYAIASMAQTRAVGKAYRLSLGWLMKAAGYEATPLEEMQDAHQPAPADAGTSATVVDEGKGVAEPTKVLASDQSKNELRGIIVGLDKLLKGKPTELMQSTLSRLHALSQDKVNGAIAHFRSELQQKLNEQAEGKGVETAGQDLVNDYLRTAHKVYEEERGHSS